MTNFERMAPLSNLNGSWGMGERLVPSELTQDPITDRILETNFIRYQRAARFVRGKSVLDIACGSGYGSYYLGENGAASVLGVDISPDAIDHARSNYSRSSVDYSCANAETFESSNTFDVICSFETVEHVENPTKLVERFFNLLAPGGLLILSSPLGETRHFDPYHTQCFSEKDILDLLQNSGFCVDYRRYDSFSMNRSEVLKSTKLYPDTRPSTHSLFFTYRGLRTLYDFIFQGGIRMDFITVLASKSTS